MEKRKNQIKTIEKIVKFNDDKKTNFLYLKHSLLEYIFTLDINSTSKVMLVYLLKNINIGFHHLYVITPYEIYTPVHESPLFTTLEIKDVDSFK